MKIALVQTNPVIGDFPGNLARIVAQAQRAAGLGCELAVFPELALSGYPPQDLLERPAFLADHEHALARLIAEVRGVGVLCGAVTRNPEAAGKPLHNSALLFRDGQILFSTAKRLLPTYDVFDESRYFEPGREAALCDYQGLKLAITVCEDIWNDKRVFPRCLYHHDPVAELLGCPDLAADLLINLAASPFSLGKNAIKQKIFANLCAAYQVPLLYVNQVGGQDSLVFEGGSLALNRSGTVICRAARFREDLVVLDTAAWQGEIREGAADGDQSDPEAAEVLAALVLGARDYVHKCGFSGVVIGLSGGIDSALTAAIAVQALGPENVLGIAMPSPYSSPASQEDARQLTANLGIAFQILPISDLFAGYRQTLVPFFAAFAGKDINGMEAAIMPAENGLRPGNGPPTAPVDITAQNIQARIRGNLLMAAANKLGRLVLSTGNKSEMAVGYCTLYGDMSGGLALLSDVPKTLVYRLAALVNRAREIIPDRTIVRPPSAELAPDQKDQDDLPPYELLDPILKAYLEENLPIAEIVAQGFDRQVVAEVVARIRRNEHKRKQAPPGLKVTSKAFGYGRRYPVAENYREDR